MGSSQRLFVTPEEHAQRVKAQNNNHPHGGEGNCGGSEGHGTPELLMKKSREGKISSSETVGAEKNASRNANGAPRQNIPQYRSRATAERNDVKNIAQNRGALSVNEQLLSAMKFSFVLGEPACRRYGLSSVYGRKLFK